MIVLIKLIPPVQVYRVKLFSASTLVTPGQNPFYSHASAPNSQLTEMALKPILPGWFRGLFCAVPGLEKSPMIQNLLSRKAPLTRQPEMLASNLDQEKSHGGPVPSCHHS